MENKLVVNGRIYDLDLLKNVQLNDRIKEMDIPGEQTDEGSVAIGQDTNQQNNGGITEGKFNQEHRGRNRNKYGGKGVWRKQHS
jgi:hypothetical protein